MRRAVTESLDLIYSLLKRDMCVKYPVLAVQVNASKNVLQRMLCVMYFTRDESQSHSQNKNCIAFTFCYFMSEILA